MSKKKLKDYASTRGDKCAFCHLKARYYTFFDYGIRKQFCENCVNEELESNGYFNVEGFEMAFDDDFMESIDDGSGWEEEDERMKNYLIFKH